MPSARAVIIKISGDCSLLKNGGKKPPIFSAVEANGIFCQFWIKAI